MENCVNLILKNNIPQGLGKNHGNTKNPQIQSYFLSPNLGSSALGDFLAQI